MPGIGWAELGFNHPLSCDMPCLLLCPTVQHGIPEALRGIVWPVLCGCRGENDNAYFQGLLEQVRARCLLPLLLVLSISEPSADKYPCSRFLKIPE